MFIDWNQLTSSSPPVIQKIPADIQDLVLWFRNTDAHVFPMNLTYAILAKDFGMPETDAMLDNNRTRCQPVYIFCDLDWSWY